MDDANAFRTLSGLNANVFYLIGVSMKPGYCIMWKKNNFAPDSKQEEKHCPN